MKDVEDRAKDISRAVKRLSKARGEGERKRTSGRPK